MKHSLKFKIFLFIIICVFSFFNLKAEWEPFKLGTTYEYEFKSGYNLKYTNHKTLIFDSAYSIGNYKILLAKKFLNNSKLPCFDKIFNKPEEYSLGFDIGSDFDSICYDNEFIYLEIPKTDDIFKIPYRANVGDSIFIKL